MKSKSEPTAGRSGAKAAGKDKLKRLGLNKETIKDLNHGQSDQVKGGAPKGICTWWGSGCCG